MTVLKRRTRDSRTEAVEGNGGGAALAVAAFEYVQVEDTALVRLTGTWSGDRGHPVDMTLVISRPSGEEQSFPALADASMGPRTHLERAVWQVAFSAPVGLVEGHTSRFNLKADHETIELPRPQLHSGRLAPPAAGEPDAPAPDEPAETDDPVADPTSSEAARTPARTAAQSQ